MRLTWRHQKKDIRIDHTSVGEERVMESSVDEVSVDGVCEVTKKPNVSGVHPLGALLHFTTKEGEAIFHPAFNEDMA